MCVSELLVFIKSMKSGKYLNNLGKKNKHASYLRAQIGCNYDFFFFFYRTASNPCLTQLGDVLTCGGEGDHSSSPSWISASS